MTENIRQRGLFISFEGIDGSGKSTQIKMLFDYLNKKNKNALVVREPGGTSISEEIRDILLRNRNQNLSSRTESLLMTASRNQLVNEIIIPKLKEGVIIIADRFADSTLAYQGGGRGLNIDWLDKLNKFATHNISPDITFYIDILPEEGIKRNISKTNDRFENAGLKFQNKVRNEYLKILELFPNRIKKINGMQKSSIVHKQILDFIYNNNYEDFKLK